MRRRPCCRLLHSQDLDNRSIHSTTQRELQGEVPFQTRTIDARLEPSRAASHAAFLNSVPISSRAVASVTPMAPPLGTCTVLMENYFFPSFYSWQCQRYSARLSISLYTSYVVRYAYTYAYGEMQIYVVRAAPRTLPPTTILVFVGPEHPLPYEGGGRVSQSTTPPGGRILPEVHAEPAAAGRLPGRRLPEAVAPEALAADVHKHRGEQGGGDLG